MSRVQISTQDRTHAKTQPTKCGGGSNPALTRACPIARPTSQGVSSSPALRSITVHRFQPRWGWLGMAGDDWGWLGEGGDGGDGSFVTEITYGKFIN